MKNKIGIITFHRSRNYGAVLQAYALQNALENMGYVLEVIDYDNQKIAKGLTLWNMPQTFRGKDIVATILQFIFRFRKKTAFAVFLHRHISLSKKYYRKPEELAELSGEYRLVITGSDQVWNEKLTDNDETYYLNFAAKDIPRIAYAVSSGDKLLINRERIKNAISDFVNISVREKAFQNFLQKNYNFTAKVCCDPTFLIGTSEFMKFVKKRPCRKKYVFLYMIHDSRELYKTAEKSASENGLILISNKNCIPFFMKCSPEDFLAWIYHAEYIITNSFHGTCFALHFEKQFVVDIKNSDGSQNQRVLDLLEHLNIGNRIILHEEEKEKTQQKLMNKIDYSEVKRQMETMKTESLKWLHNVVK